MKKRIFSLALALVLTLALAAPVFAEEEGSGSPMRLVKADDYANGELSVSWELIYEGDSLLPCEVRATRVSDGATVSDLYSYDDAGRVIQYEGRSLGQQLTVTYSYGDGNMVCVTQSSGNPVNEYTMEYTYDENGLRTGASCENYNNGFHLYEGLREEQYEYDADGNMIHRLTMYNGDTIGDNEYEYDRYFRLNMSEGKMALVDSEGYSICSFEGFPTTYDEAGYPVEAMDTEGWPGESDFVEHIIKFTYEPVA